mmetsp:Transcript_5108/g.11683  ORF Transcript_5108/g.11683 Transcript_5108/m.11683 type:complete len:253 (+) Transcript_5108:408-1166(+)
MPGGGPTNELGCPYMPPPGGYPPMGGAPPVAPPCETPVAAEDVAVVVLDAFAPRFALPVVLVAAAAFAAAASSAFRFRLMASLLFIHCTRSATSRTFLFASSAATLMYFASGVCSVLYFCRPSSSMLCSCGLHSTLFDRLRHRGSAVGANNAGDGAPAAAVCPRTTAGLIGSGPAARVEVGANIGGVGPRSIAADAVGTVAVVDTMLGFGTIGIDDVGGGIMAAAAAAAAAEEEETSGESEGDDDDCGAVSF